MSTLKGKTLLSGHTLVSEGQPLGMGARRSGQGIGGCSCGARSPLLPSNSARQRWHKQHKEEIRAVVPVSSVATKRIGGQNLMGITFIAPDEPMSEEELKNWYPPSVATKETK